MIAAAGVLEEDGEEELAPIVLRKKRRFGVLHQSKCVCACTEDLCTEENHLVVLQCPVEATINPVDGQIPTM